MSTRLKTLISLGVAHAMLECFSGVWPIYKTLAHLDLRVAGLIGAATMLIASVLQPAWGVWADRGNARLMMLIGTALTFLTMLIGPFAGQMESLGRARVYTIISILMLFSRLGHGMFHPPAASMAGRVYIEKQSASIGLFIALGWVGYAFSQIVFSTTFLHAEGHTEWLLIPGVLVLAWIAAWCRPEPAAHHSSGSLRQKIALLWQVRRDVGGLFLLLCMTSATSSALMFMFPELLIAKGYSGWVLNGGAVGILVAGIALGVVLGGHIADRIGAHTTLVISLGVTFIVQQIFLILPHMPDTTFALVCFAVGVLFGAGQPLPLAISQTILPRDASMISGVMMGWTWGFGGLAQLAAGYMVECDSLGVVGTLSLIGILNLVAMFCAMTVPAARPVANE